jgi:hypothetical protein
MTKRVRNAYAVEWAGLCLCGCGSFKAVLVDEHDKPIASFGWDREGWISFLAGVMRQIDGEQLDETVCEHHTAH